MTCKVLLLAGVIFIVSSCKKDAETETGQSRMFSPSAIKSSTTETSAKLTWEAPLFAGADSVKYNVEVSTDSTFQAIRYTGTTDTAGIRISYPDLAIKETYYARIKAAETAGKPESKWTVSSSFRIPGAQIFSAVQATDIVDNAVILRWQSRAGLTKIVLTPASGTSISVNLTADDVSGTHKLISGLTSGITYTAEIFKDALTQGTVTFKTKDPLAGTLIDLREITNRPSVLADTITDVPAGSTIILKRGFQYNIETAVSLDKSVKIISGSDLTVSNPATIYITGSINVTAGSTIDYIDFEDVYLRGDTYGSSAGRYVMNVSNACTIGRLSFESCKVNILRGVIRFQSAASILVNKFILNNTIVDNVGGYGLLTLDAGKVDDIVITNSTLYMVEKVVVTKTATNSINIEKCTINEAPLSGNYLIDFGGTSVGSVNGIAIKNVILGVGKATSTGATVVRGIRTSATTNVIVSGSYNTSDYTTSANVISGLNAYSGKSTDLFTDPVNGNFKIKDSAFAGVNTAGDPRWR